MVTFGATVFAFSVIDWKKELHSDVKLYLLFGFVGLLTVGLVVLTFRTVAGRYKNAAAEMVVSEV